MTQLTAEGKRAFVPSRFHLCPTSDDSRKLNGVAGPGVIIAGSGMATGGRILHHLRHRLPDEASAAAALRAAIEQHLGWRCAVAADRQQIDL
ncbi:MAG: hypothetical protein DMD99_24695 [Candidatus Rokuibacteriota bacterium]|nr:MAG: hypothetical protein DMD99_24695 [Candidatus Rokubacteria bacterium]